MLVKVVASHCLTTNSGVRRVKRQDEAELFQADPGTALGFAGMISTGR
jgi:hypothetical protein